MAHFAGLVAAGLHPNPVPALRLRHLDDAQDARRPARRVHPLHARSTRRRSTARSSRACRAARSSTRSRPRRPASGSPRPTRSASTRRRCARTPTRSPPTLQDGRLDVLTGGTDTHLLQRRPARDRVDRQGRGGAAGRGEADGRTATPCPSTSGRRRSPPGSGSARPPATMRGFDEDDFREVGHDHLSSALAGRRRTSAALARPQRGALREAAALPGLPRLHHLRRVTETLPGRHGGRRTRSSSTSSSYLRDKDTPTVHFRKLANELTLAAHLRGDEGLPDRDRSRSRRRSSATTVQRIAGQEGRGLPGPARRPRDARRRALADLRARASASSASTATRRRSQPVEYYVKLPESATRRARRDRARPDARHRTLERGARSRGQGRPARARSRWSAWSPRPKGSSTCTAKHPDVRIVYAADRPRA